MSFLPRKFPAIQYIYILLPRLRNVAASPQKKRKLEKRKSEKAMEKAIDSFMQYQREAEERFLEYEDENGRDRIVGETEERRRGARVKNLAMLG